MGIKTFPRMLLLVLLLTASQVWSAELTGRSSSQIVWFNDFYQGRQVELSEYLRLGAKNIDSAGKLSVYGYGRGGLDLNNGSGLNGRLYYLYGEYRDLYDLFDVRVGRQFVNVSAGTTIIDGGQFDLKNIGPVGFSAFGGRDVVFGYDGELGHEGNYAIGVAAYLTGFRKTDLDISWFRKWDAGDVSRDIIGASFKQYLLDRLKLYGNARYDITSEIFSEVLGGIKYFPTANLVLTGEWFQSYPTFDTTDIYSVFAADRYREWVFRANYTVNEKLGVFAGYNRQSYNEGSNANVYEAGLTVRPLPGLTVGLEYDRHDGYGGRLDGGMFDVTWDATKDLQVAGGLTVDSYQREIAFSENGEHIAQKYWLGGKYRIARAMNASVRLEENVNENYTHDLQGRFVFNYDF